MTILHLIDSIKPGGAENVMVNYIKVCNDLGYSSIIVGKPSSKDYEKSLSNIADIRYKLDISLIGNSDAIFVHSNHSLLNLIRYKSLIKSQSTRIIYIQHLNYRPWKFRIISYFINSLCTDFIQITPIIEKAVETNIKIQVWKINNFYINKYLPEERDPIRKKIRAELGINDNTCLVTFSAIFKPGKGLPDFIKLAEECKDDKNYHFLVIGDGDESSYVKNYTHPNLTWLGRQTDVEKYLIASDRYIFTSRFALEMMPMALIEAINVDLPCIAFPTDINNYLLNNSTFGTINKEALEHHKLPKSKSLHHYNKEYGIKQLKALLKDS